MMYGEMQLQPSLITANVWKDVLNADGITLTQNSNARTKQSTSTRMNATQGSTPRTYAWQVKTNTVTGPSLLTKIRILRTEPAELSPKATLKENGSSAVKPNRWGWKVCANMAAKVVPMLFGRKDSAGGHGPRVNSVKVTPKECTVACLPINSVISDTL